MVKPFLYAILLFAPITSQVFANKDDIEILVKYAHGPLKVHYTLPCKMGQTSTLFSETNSKRSWHIAITPSWASHEAVRIDALILEAGKVVQRPTVILSLGESASVTVEDTGDRSELTLKRLSASY